MFGISGFIVFVVIALSVLIAVIVVDYNKNGGCSMLSPFAIAILAFAVLVAAGIRTSTIKEYKQSMPFKNPLVLTNGTPDTLLFKVRAETTCISKMIEVPLGPGEMQYFSCYDGGYCVLDTCKLDNSNLEDRYASLVKDED